MTECACGIPHILPEAIGKTDTGILGKPFVETRRGAHLQSDLSVWFGANPSVPAACADKSGLQTAEGCKTNGMDDFAKIKFWTTPVAKCATQTACVPYYRWCVGLYRRDRRALTTADIE